MTTLMLVDDEDFIRQGMRYAIPWEEHDIKVIAEASNGKEALDLAVQLKPDIILADIQMPVMSGLELAKEISRILPATRMIILTAYGSTENLSNAINIKVSASLVKSADRNKILEAVLKEKDALEKSKQQLLQFRKMQNIYDENRHLIKATLLTRFLEKQISYSHFSKKAAEMGICLLGDSFVLCLIKCSCKDEHFVLGQCLYHFQEYQPFCFFTKDQLVAVILNTDETPLDDTHMMQILPGLLPVAFGNCIVIMEDLHSYSDFPLAYTMLYHALDHCFWNSSSPYSRFTPRDNFTKDSEICIFPLETSVIKAVLTTDASQIKEQFQNYYSYLEQQKVSRQFFMDSIMRLLVSINAVSREEIQFPRIQELLDEAETPGEILELVLSLTLPDSPVTSNSQIQSALDYIYEHCTEDIFLEDVAKAVFLSPGYLCRIMKPETGYSFKEYLHKLRIEKAQKLIRNSDLKYYEIAEKVGYKNYKYFSSYFSKITGCSAKEYRMRINSQT